MDTLDINEALRIYLDADPRSGGVRPYGMVERIQSKYGSRSPTVLEEIKRVIGDLYDEEEVVGLKSLQDIGAFPEAGRIRRPDLEDDVCKAIGKHFLLLSMRRGFMIAFRVQLNRGEAVTAGLSGEHVVSVFADSAAGERKHQPPGEPPTSLRMSVSGLRSSEDGSKTHVRWLNAPLTIGDGITVSVVVVAESDISRPIDERPATEVTESSERKRLAYLIEKYGTPAGA